MARSQGAREMVRLVCAKAVGGRPLNSVVRPQLMTRTGLIYAAFISVSVVTAVAAIIGLDVHARMTFAGMSYESAHSEVMRTLHLVPDLISCAPFIVLGAMAARFGARHNLLIAILIFAMGALAIAYFYYDGYLDAQAARKDRMWTAASLSLGTSLFKSIALLFAMQLGIEAIGKKKEWTGS